jgi:hypothetical protein
VIINHLNAQLNPICHLLALLGAHHILHISRLRVNLRSQVTITPTSHLNNSLNIQPIPVHIHHLNDKFFCHCLLRPNPLTQQIRNYAPAGLTNLYKIKTGKSNAVPLQAWSGPEGSRKLRFPDFMTTAQDGGKIVSITHRPLLPPGNTPGTHFC